MRDWIVEGIDHKTGNARRLRINAQDEKQASSIAYTMGVTAQRVYVAGAPEPEASAMEQLGLAAHDRAASRPPARSSPAKNREFSSAGRRLRAADTILSAIGWIYVVLAVVALFLAIVTLLNSTPGHGALSAFTAGTLIVYAIMFAIAGALFLGLGAALRMLALIGEGIRDLNR